MKKTIQDGYIGPIDEIVLIDVRVQMGSLLHNKFDWLCDSNMGGGNLNLIGSHVVDLVSFLTGKRAIRVHGVVKTYTKSNDRVNGIRQISAPDFCSFQMELESGILVTATLHSHPSNNNFSQEIQIFGKDGHLVVRGGDLYGQKTKSTKEEVIYLDVEDFHCQTSDSTLPKVYIKGICKMVGALRETFLSKSGWVKPVAAACFEDGLYVQAVLDAIRKSSEERAWIKINIMTESPTAQNKFMNAALQAVALN